MNYSELERKMREVYNALDNKNGLMQCNKDGVCVVLIEIKNEIEQVESLCGEKLEVEKEIKKFLAETNRAQAHQNFIFNSEYKFDKKIEEFAEASRITAEYAKILNEMKYYLKNLESEIEKSDAENKMQLVPYWDEMLEKFDVYAIISPNELHVYSSEEKMQEQVNMQTNQVMGNDLKQLVNSLGDDIFNEIKPKRRKVFGLF